MPAKLWSALCALLFIVACGGHPEAVTDTDTSATEAVTEAVNDTLTTEDEVTDSTDDPTTTGVDPTTEVTTENTETTEVTTVDPTTDTITTTMDDTTTSDIVCGDGVVEGEEECDGELEGGFPCSVYDADYVWGEVSQCSANCTFDLSSCQQCQVLEPEPCDANSVDPLEVIGVGCHEGELLDFQLDSPDYTAFRFLTQFGNALDENEQPVWGPRQGERFLMLTNGSLPEPNNGNLVLSASYFNGGNMDNNNPAWSGLPGSLTWEKGADEPLKDCDQIKDCSNSLAEYWLPEWNKFFDPISLHFSVQVPKGTFGYEFDVAYFTAEYSWWVNTPFNDVVLIWVESEGYTGNLLYFFGEKQMPQPFISTALANEGMITYQWDDPEMGGTGFQDVEAGGATGWLTVRGPAKPEEVIKMTVILFDIDDQITGSALLVDGWKWTCDRCESELGECGVQE